MKNRVNDKINIEIMENELSASDWEFNSLAWELRWWIDFFNMAFFKDQPVAMPALSFERTRVNTLGHYVPGRNSMGLLENINLNRANLNRPLWDILATLLHEMVHSYEYTYVPEAKRTKGWYHTKAFRLKLAEFGILSSEKGVHMAVGDPFVFLLRKHGVEFGTYKISGGLIQIPPKPKKKGKSKLKKWSCGCQNARVGKAEFEATCNLCENRFELVA